MPIYLYRPLIGWLFNPDFMLISSALETRTSEASKNVPTQVIWSTHTQSPDKTLRPQTSLTNNNPVSPANSAADWHLGIKDSCAHVQPIRNIRDSFLRVTCPSDCGTVSSNRQSGNSLVAPDLNIKAEVGQLSLWAPRLCCCCFYFWVKRGDGLLLCRLNVSFRCVPAFSG